LPAEPAVAARWSVAVMELGALVCTAASPRCGDCPVARECAWLAAGRPAPPAGSAGLAGATGAAGAAGTAGLAGATRAAGASRAAGGVGAGRRRTQKYDGTDRQCRGRLLAVLREASDPVHRADFDAVWAGQAQLERALDGLVADGLVDPLPDGRFALPGSVPVSRRGWGNACGRLTRPRLSASGLIGARAQTAGRGEAGRGRRVGDLSRFR